MKTSQKYLFSFLLAAIILAFAATAVLAETPPLEPLVEPGKLNLNDKLGNVGGRAGFDQDANSLPEIIGRVVQIFLSVLGMVFMGYIIYAGSLWLTARGDEEKITKAKAILRGSITGLVIVFAAYAITSFVLFSVIEETNFSG